MNPKKIDILTAFQKDVLKALAQESFFKDFYLTGGTALAALYLCHRHSEDLDFFTENPQAVVRIHPLVKRLAQHIEAQIELGRRFETLFECSLVNKKGERLEMDFALDMPGRLAPLKMLKGFKIKVDNPLDIACNKLSALYERSEAKDFIDIFFIDQQLFKLEDLISKARRKYGDLDTYGLAMAFLKIKGITWWPRMVRPFDRKKVRQFYLSHAKRLAQGFA